MRHGHKCQQCLINQFLCLLSHIGCEKQACSCICCVQVAPPHAPTTHGSCIAWQCATIALVQPLSLLLCSHQAAQTLVACPWTTSTDSCIFHSRNTPTCMFSCMSTTCYCSTTARLDNIEWQHWTLASATMMLPFSVMHVHGWTSYWTYAHHWTSSPGTAPLTPYALHQTEKHAHTCSGSYKNACNNEATVAQVEEGVVEHWQHHTKAQDKWHSWCMFHVSRIWWSYVGSLTTWPKNMPRNFYYVIEKFLLCNRISIT